jgi:hypothetical protein
MEMNKVTAAAVVMGILAISFAIAPLALATTSSSSYPFELTGRIEYVVPSGTPNPFGNVGGAVVIFYAPAVGLTGSFSWTPASSYTTSPGHGL